MAPSTITMSTAAGINISTLPRSEPLVDRLVDRLSTSPPRAARCGRGRRRSVWLATTSKACP